MEFHQNDNSTSVLSTTLIVRRCNHKINVRDTSKKDVMDFEATISPASFGISIASIQQVKKIHIYVIKDIQKKNLQNLHVSPAIRRFRIKSAEDKHQSPVVYGIILSILHH
ncbi:unnamed protein product [Rhizophagus irregularis]|nr:unnamed protein product [Rhizophagus irregularis]